MTKLPFSKQVAMEAAFTGDGPAIFKGYKHNLTGAYLRGLMLEGGNLDSVTLAHADLKFAKLARTKLDGTDLKHAKMNYADLPAASLVNANLSYANLELAILRGADLSNAVLEGACLKSADLRNADLSGANLEMAVFHEAWLGDVVWDGPEQLSKVATLYKVKGLDPIVKERLLDEYPRLFERWDNKPMSPL